MRKKILDCNWLNHPSIQYLSKIFEDSGYDILFVGGCVRNSILKEPVSDFDIATAAHPEEIISITFRMNYLGFFGSTLSSFIIRELGIFAGVFLSLTI